MEIVPSNFMKLKGFGNNSAKNVWRHFQGQLPHVIVNSKYKIIVNSINRYKIIDADCLFNGYIHGYIFT